jgi:dipeptidase D
MSDRPFEGLAPSLLWKHFEALTRVARPSGREEAAADYVRTWAGEQGYALDEDAVGNLVVRVPGHPDAASQDPVVLQGHLDMVCERNADSPWDAAEGRLHVVREDGWITAEGTTLGADNGIGVAAGLAAAEDPDLVHPPLEILLTRDEETGLTGAKGLDASLLRGRILLNLDSEDDDVLFVGCAGGTDTRYRLPFTRTAAPRGWRPMRIRVGGLRGGHSGLDIIQGRMNAIQALARILVAVGEGLRVATFQGGRMRNAIPREAEATVVLDPARDEDFRRAVDETSATLRSQFAGIDDDLQVGLGVTDAPDGVLPAEVGARLLAFLTALPSGVVTMSRDIEGLVETSTNLGVVTTEKDHVHVISCSRSSVAEALDQVLLQLRSIARLAGAEAVEHGGYPGWKPDLTSPVLATVKGAYARLFGAEPGVTAIHAGLECGLIGERVPGMDMVSFGPAIRGAHSPDERVSIASVEKFYRLLGAVLQELGGRS